MSSTDHLLRFENDDFSLTVRLTAPNHEVVQAVMHTISQPADSLVVIPPDLGDDL